MEVVAVQSLLIPKALKALKAEELHKGIKQTSYFDPNHSFVFLGAESSIPYTTEHPWPHRRECVLEYNTAADGKQPMPKRFTRYFQKENGEKLIDYEIDYKTYEDFVPDPEEFRLEKRYGLTTPVGPEDKVLAGKRGSPSSRRAWYWALFLVATVLVAGFVFFRYRRRRIARVPSTSGKS